MPADSFPDNLGGESGAVFLWSALSVCHNLFSDYGSLSWLVMTKKHLRNLSFGLLGVLLVVLMAATCVEKVWGTGWVVRYVYGASWFAVC